MQRVVVTGMGAVTPVGRDVPAMWQSLLAGRSGIGPITYFDATPFATRIAGQVNDFDATAYLSPKRGQALGAVRPVRGRRGQAGGG